MRRFKIEPILVTGYHGTSLEAAEDILREGFKPSRRPWEWLGHGIYFWQDAPIRAFEWATEWLGQKGYTGPIAVVSGYRAAVVEGKPLTLNSPIHELSHVQLAVIEPDVILRTWMVESDAEGAP